MYTFLLVSTLSVCTMINAEPTRNRDEKPAWPEALVAQVGDVLIRVDGPKLWTMSGIDFQGQVMAVEDSAYGTVITIRGVGHLGTAHFLDVPGKPGEVEKENVTDLHFFLDDKPLTELQPKMAVSGKSFRVERKSTIRTLNLESSVDLRDGVLVETARMRATQPIDLQMSYPLMYAWSPENTLYMFGDDRGVQSRGVFHRLDQPKHDNGLEKTARWMAVFNPKNGKGSVCYLVKRPLDADAWFQWTDGPGIYRKLRIQTFVEKVMPQGFDGTFQSAVGFFSAEERDWEAAALRRIEDLKQRAAALNQKNWPQTILVAVGDVRTRLEADKMWTMSGIDFQDNVMAVQDSAYGTVLTIRDVGHLGTAHFLDIPGKPAEVEKELVTRLDLFLDEKPIQLFTPRMELNGHSFRAERTSQMRGLRIDSSVAIHNGVLFEKANLNFNQPIDLVKAHPLMYAFTPTATEYAFGNESGVMKQGTFASNGKVEMSVKDARWMAVFDSRSRNGSVCYFQELPKLPETRFLIIDAAGVYRKLALHTFDNQIAPMGFNGTYQSAIGFFSAEPSQWIERAAARAKELKDTKLPEAKQ